MTYNNYVIPEKITEEDEFMYGLVEDLSALSQDDACILGELDRIVLSIKDERVAEKLSSFYDELSSHLSSYGEIRSRAKQRWTTIGSPLSLSAHQAKKRYYDEKDRIKSDR